jgi:hypothetical protein
MRLAARIEGVGLVGPGIASWEQARPILSGAAAYESKPTVLPAPEALPAVERRRAGKCVRISLAAGLGAAADAGREARDLAAIFSSSTGDGENLHAICEALASDDRLISPTRFHNSVHNAPAGYWGIATGAMKPSDCLAAFDASFGAGLVEALGRLAADPSLPVLLIAYDAPYPEPLHAVRPTPDSMGVGLVLVAPDAASAATVRCPIISIAMSKEAPTPLADAALESLRRAIPAARALPLLALLAAGKDGRVVLEYLEGASLAVEVTH